MTISLRSWIGLALRLHGESVSPTTSRIITGRRRRRIEAGRCARLDVVNAEDLHALPGQGQGRADGAGQRVDFDCWGGSLVGSSPVAPTF